MRVAVFIGTRADLGPLGPVVAAFAAEGGVETHVLCGVAFDAAELSGRLAEETSGVFDGTVHALTDPLRSLGVEEMLLQGERLLHGARELFARISFDALVVLGDRWELLFVVPAAYLSGIRIVHLHGGEVTEGALDERVRHAVTKLADLHCVASADAAERLRQLGEPEERIALTGAPGLDRLDGRTRVSDEELSELLGAAVSRPLALYTYHPPTAVVDAPLHRSAADVLRATLESCAMVIVTAPGMDTGRDEIIAAHEEIAARDPRVLLVDSLGPRYPVVLASADVVVGNSSSGVIEAASVGVPAVDVGMRQAGRLRGNNVIHADENYESVRAAVQQAMSGPFIRTARAATNPYGDGHAAQRIVAATLTLDGLPAAKRFADRTTRS